MKAFNCLIVDSPIIPIFELKSTILKILVILSRYPWPLEKGDKLRAYHFIRCLSEKHEIILCALHTAKLEEQDLNALKPYCSEIKLFKLNKLNIFFGLTRSFFKKLPFQTGFFYRSSVVKKIKEIEQEHKPDKVIGQLLRVGPYMLKLKSEKIIDFQDALSKNMSRRANNSKGLEKWLFEREAKLLYKYEEQLLHKIDKHIIISEPDEAALPKVDGIKTEIVRNGVDFNFFKPNSEVEKKYDLVFTGNMSYAPNIDSAVYLVKSIMPEIWKINPDIKILIAGAFPVQRVRQLASDKVHVSGFMDDIRDAYYSASVFIAPMRIGSGLQNKLLEAMAMQIPCITSELANSSLEAKPDSEILIADTPENYAKCALELLDNKEKADKIAHAGYEMVTSRFNWESIINEFDNNILR